MPQPGASNRMLRLANRHVLSNHHEGMCNRANRAMPGMSWYHKASAWQGNRAALQGAGQSEIEEWPGGGGGG